MFRRRLPSYFLLVAILLAVAPSSQAQEGCTWPATFGAKEINMLAPDDATNYWVAPFVAIPGHRIVVRGQFPSARYFSITIND